MAANSNPRSLAVQCVERWEQSAEFIDYHLAAVIPAGSGISERDRHFLHELVLGVIRNLRLLDFFIDRLTSSKLDKRVRNLLRCGIYQIRNMRVADHAAVNETVNDAGRAKSLVNAVLRRLIRELPAMEELLEKQPAPVVFSHPDFLVDRWQKIFGDEETLRLLEWNNGRAPMYARINMLAGDAGDVIRNSAIAEPAAGRDDVFRLTEFNREWLEAGLCYIQDPGTLMACDLLDPQPGERVMDACAAPGGKSAYLAQKMHNRGTLACCDNSMERLKLLGGNLSRMHVDIAGMTLVHWEKPHLMSESVSDYLRESLFDRILLDVPCSNTGVMQRRADVRWRLAEEDFQRMSERQFAIVANVLPFLKPGGTLVYSTCSIDPEENSELAEKICSELPLSLAHDKSILPWKDGIDGAYAAVLIKSES